MTSGTTRDPFNVIWTRKDMIRSLFHHWNYRRQHFGIDASNRFCSFHSFGMNPIPEIEYKEGNRNISYNKRYFCDDTIRVYYEHMLFIKPSWLFIQPSIAYILASFLHDNNYRLPSSVRYIELIGEHAFPKYRKFFEEVFSLPTSNMYGCTETNGIAYECPNGKFHLLTLNVAVVVLNDSFEPVGYGEHGEICLTGLCNTAMPFIRYTPGDHVVLYPADTCSCGLNTPVLEVIAGRLGELFFAGGSGGYKNCRITYPINRVSINHLSKNAILLFQLIKRSSCCYTVVFDQNKSNAPDREWLKNEFINEMNDMGLHRFSWSFDFNGKLQPDAEYGAFVINKVK
jgi:phenylacetate-coenzyme A ligase PaaK-like adenylate-forming protein